MALSCAQSFAGQPDQIVRQLRDGLAGIDASLVILYASPRDDLGHLARLATQAFAPALVVGCTTAGEIGPSGYVQGSVTALALAARDFSARAVLLEGIRHFNPAQAQARLGDALHHAKPDGCFALTLMDGLCGAEELVISAVHAALGAVPVAGGSAGDGLRFGRSWLIHEGALHEDAALVLLVSTARPFQLFKTEHFVTGAERVVVTRADREKRLVQEINARPAAHEYARLVGHDVAALGPEIFARHPLMVRVGGNNFVRSIKAAHQDGALSFFCAIDSGLVLKVGQGVDVAETLMQRFSQIRGSMGPPAGVIGFDCLFRRLELAQTGELHRVGAILAENRVYGFSTYGEQYQGMHVNQTLTGVVIGDRA